VPKQDKNVECPCHLTWWLAGHSTERAKFEMCQLLWAHCHYIYNLLIRRPQFDS